VQYLLAWGADVNARDSAGFTPLHLAIKDVEIHKVFTTVKKLIFKGANPSLRDSIGRRPVELVGCFKDKMIKEKAIRTLSISQNFCQSLYHRNSIQEMKKSVSYLFLFIIIMAVIILFIMSILYPNLDGAYWKISLAILSITTGLTFILSWFVSPGYLTKKAEGEFLLLLTKFDPKSLCPFCEVV
jgi:hypothetical protein